MRPLLILLVCLCFFACKNDDTPDVSNIKVDLQVQRFEKAFFSVDTSRLEAAFPAWQTQYRSFVQDYFVNILGLESYNDSAQRMINQFYRNYLPVYAEVTKLFPDLNNAEQQVRYSFQLTKHYFPQYELPKKLISFIGPIEGYSTVLTQEGVAVGLQQYLGKDHPLYTTEQVRTVYPAYIVRRFEPAYIPVNVMKNVIEDLYPPARGQQKLIDIMIEQGKRLYLLDELMPSTHDTLITGYTEKQLEGCYENEALIWNFFIQNDLLYQSDPFLIREYINEGPKTTALGEGSPGNIGQFVGWQIIKKYVDGKKDITLQQLLNTPPNTILQEAKYKPK